MGRSYRLLLGVLVAAMVVPAAVYAGIPDPSLSDAPNVLYSPGGDLEYIVTVNGSSGPIADATVQLVFSGEADTLVAWCVGQTHPTIEATTDVNGEAHFFIGAGGCIDPSQVAAPPAVEVFANGIKLNEVGAVSPDVVDAGGVLPWLGWNPGPITSVGGNDGSFLGQYFKTSVYNYCADLNSDGVVAGDDASLAGPAIKNSTGCTIQ
jgi:hypothetical protein